jgi:DsbC/DsbD-like thiol-disulfide interchange protein/cytochrome c biogenesis protein CcdA
MTGARPFPALVALLLALMAWSGLGAQDFARPTENMDRGRAALVVEGAAAPGDTIDLALVFEPDEGWHGYWANPGDAGLGMTLDWRLPPGWSAGEPRYPVPGRLMIGGLMNHVYKGPHAVLVPVMVPADARPGTSVPVAVAAQWLTCSDTLCVPQWATLRAEVAIAAEHRGDGTFSRWRAAIAPPLDRPGTFARAGDSLRIAIPLPANLALADPHVFLAERDLIAYAAPQTFRRKGDMLIADLPLAGGAAVPERISGIVSFGAGEGVRFEAAPGEVSIAGARVLASAEAPALLALIAAALLGGLLLNVMPCVFPILSLKALSLAKSGESEAAARREGLAYTAGAVVACLALGAVLLGLRAAGESVGWAFQLQEPGVVVALLLLAVIVTANLGGVFELPALPITRGGNASGAFATGLFAAFVATPCTGPFMAAALGAALVLPPVEALALFGALGLGLALPFLAVGLFPALRRRLPKPGPWMARFRRAMAVPMGLTALALIWLTARLGGQGFALVALVAVAGVVVALLVVGRLQRAGKLAFPAFALIAAPFALFAAFALPASFAPASARAAESVLDPIPFSETALAEARASGRPVFVWFTADWCVSCKVNESVAIEREATRAAFEEAGVVTLRGDWTRRDAAIAAFLAEQGAAGVPLYLWYEPGGEAEQLPQVLTPDLLAARARR